MTWNKIIKLIRKKYQIEALILFVIFSGVLWGLSCLYIYYW